ncbi:MAG: acyltransferase [Nanoarchaeota archaeon]
MNFPEGVYLGKNVKREQGVILGAGSRESGNIIIGDNSILRSGTIIYYGNTIGDNFETHHNTVIRPGNRIGRYVVIGSNTEIAPGNRIGNFTRIHSLCFLEKTTLGNYVFVAPGVKFLDDFLPVDPDPTHYKGAIVGDDVSIGGGSTILPGVEIGNTVLIGAGSVLTKSVPAGEVWHGNPAEFKRKIEGLVYPSTSTQYLPGTRVRWEKRGVK